MTATPTRALLPYPGLRPFEREEANTFFGRETQIDAMVDRLGRHLAGHWPEQLHKQTAAREIDVERGFHLDAAERQARFRQYQDALLLEIPPQFKPAELKIIGDLGEERRACAVAAV